MLANEWGGNCVTDTGVATLKCIPVVFNRIIEYALMFSGVVAFFFVVYAGIKFITSGGDPKQVDTAKKTLTLAIVGLLVVLFAYLILNLIAYATGADCIRFFGFESCK